MTDKQRQKAMRDFFWSLVNQKEKVFGCVTVLVNDLFDDDEEYKHTVKTKIMKALGHDHFVIRDTPLEVIAELEEEPRGS